MKRIRLLRNGDKWDVFDGENLSQDFTSWNAAHRWALFILCPCPPIPQETPK